MTGLSPAIIWGFLGALVYATPNLLACLRSPGDHRMCWAIWIVALVIGPIFAEAGTDWIGYRVPWLVEPSPTALQLIIGLCANPLAPTLARLATRIAASRLSAHLPKEPVE